MPSLERGISSFEEETAATVIKGYFFYLSFISCCCNKAKSETISMSHLAYINLA